MKRAYSRACIELLLSGKAPETVFAGLKTTLDQKGYQKLLVPILRDMLRELSRVDLYDHTNVHTTDAVTFKKLEKEIEESLATHSFNKEYSVVYDETLVGGFTLKNRNKLLDKSFKRSLIRLYTSFS